MTDETENGSVTEEQNVNDGAVSEAPAVEAAATEAETTEAVTTEAVTTEAVATEVAVVETPAPLPDVIWGTGRRKSSVARVRIKNGTGRVLVNGRDYKEYFPSIQYQNVALAPLRVTSTRDRFDVFANIKGGGLTGQAGALSLGIARAMKIIDQSLEETLREKNLMTRDPRMKERKKYGLHGARRGVQFSKR